jgi:uncharacterized protein YunC (DUF1805 family)
VTISIYKVVSRPKRQRLFVNQKWALLLTTCKFKSRNNYFQQKFTRARREPPLLFSMSYASGALTWIPGKVTPCQLETTLIAKYYTHKHGVKEIIFIYTFLYKGLYFLTLCEPLCKKEQNFNKFVLSIQFSGRNAQFVSFTQIPGYWVSYYRNMSLNNEIVKIMRKIMAIQGADRVLQATVINTARRLSAARADPVNGSANNGLSVVNCHYFHEKYLFIRLPDTCIL